MNKNMTLSLLSAAVLLAGCGDNNPAEEKAIQKVAIASLGGKVERDSLYFPAVANAAERSHLSFRVAGEVNKVHVKEGDQLKKGDVIAEIDPTDYQLEVDNASARYTVIDSQYKRSKPLVEKGLLAKSQFDEIAAKRQIAYAELELTKLHLSFTKIYAPVDGIISRVSVDQFENIQVGQQVVNIHSVEDVEVLIQVPDRLTVNKSNAGLLDDLRALVRVPSGNEYVASIKEFTTEPDPSTGTFTVTATLPMPENEYILDGMAVEVTAQGESIGLELNTGVRVPIEAIFNGDGDTLDRNNKYVWILNDDSTVSKQKITVGRAFRTSLQVLDGLDSQNKVVIAGVAKLQEGMQVDVIAKEAGNE